MNDNDAGIAYLRARGVGTDSLSCDGFQILEVAKLALSSDITTLEGRNFVRAGYGMRALANVVAFVTESPLSSPASSRANHVEVSQSYAKLLRVMCLRLWADSTFSSIENEHPLFFPKAPRNEVPWGAELLWHDQVADQAVPNWYTDAFGSLGQRRKRCFIASYSYALLFVLLHEFGHIRCGHFSNKQQLDSVVKELEADHSAMSAMFYSSQLPCLGKQVAHLTTLQMAVGVLAALLTFHLLLVKNTPATAGQVRHRGYPAASERVSQLIQLLSLRKQFSPGTWFDDYTEVVSLLSNMAALHPAFGYVIGTGWIGYGYKTLRFPNAD